MRQYLIIKNEIYAHLTFKAWHKEVSMSGGASLISYLDASWIWVDFSLNIGSAIDNSTESEKAV